MKELSSLGRDELSGLGRDELLKIIERLERHCDEQAVELSEFDVCACGHARKSHEKSEGRCLVECRCEGFEKVIAPTFGRALPPRPKIVCLCGSTRFGEAFRKANFDETLAGKIVLTVGCDFKSDDALGLSADVKARLDELHKRKIDLADEVLVLNVSACAECGQPKREDGNALDCPILRCGKHLWKPYIGESTTSEILYAASLGKHIRWLNPPGCFTLPNGDCVGAGCMHDVKEAP